MDTCAQKLLESATHKTLHAHAFSRASTQATVVLTDLLARYLTLLTSSCAKYAGHAGRRKLTVYDALEALKELGTSMGDLEEYGAGEGRELGRYGLHSGRRQEELNEFRSQLSDGLKQDRGDSILLEYAPYDGHLSSDEESESENEEEDADAEYDAEWDDAMDMDVDDGLPHKRSRQTPPPRSPSLSPSRKRARTAKWDPPSYVPSFLPPFPSTDTTPAAAPNPSAIPDSAHPSPSQQPHQLLPEEKGPLQVPPALTTTATTTSVSDMLVQVPYSQSSLATLPERHLPGPPPPPPRSSALTSTNATASSSTTPGAPSSSSSSSMMPQVNPSFIAAYHYILTHPAPSTPSPSTLQRHRVAMSLLNLIQSNSRWTPSDSLYGSISPCPPRTAGVPPSYPVALADLGADGKPGGGSKETSFKFPQTNSRPVAAVERLAPLVGQPSSRLPDLARHVLHPTILNRSTRLVHPPILHRGSKPLVYGPGVPAPWNSNPVPTPDASGGVPQTPIISKPKDSSSFVNGKSDEESSKPVIPDALLFATWDYDSKDYRVPLPRHRTRMGSIAGGSSGTTITLPHITRKNSTK